MIDCSKSRSSNALRSRKAEHGRLIQGFANQARHYLSSIISWWQNGSCWFSKRSLSRSSTMVMNLALIPKDCYHRSTRRRWCICKEFTACQVRWFGYVTKWPQKVWRSKSCCLHIYNAKAIRTKWCDYISEHVVVLYWFGANIRNWGWWKQWAVQKPPGGCCPIEPPRKKVGVESEWQLFSNVL